MTRIDTYRLFGFCVAVASGAAMLQGCSDSGSGAGGTAGSTGATTGGTGTTTGGTGTTTGGSTTGGSTTTTGTGGGSKQVTYCMSSYPAPLPVTSAMISDFDGEGGVLVQSIMPGGVWAVDTDGTGTPKELVPNVTSCGTTGNGIHFAGTGHTVWGADVAAAVVAQTQSVDVSSYSGISFVLKPVANTNLIFKVQNPYSQPGCGLCTDQAVGAPPPPVGTECYPGFIKNVSLVANDATPIVVKWTDLMQQGWGYHPPTVVTFDPANLVSIAFAFDKNVDFDVCLDDVKFVQ